MPASEEINAGPVSPRRTLGCRADRNLRGCKGVRPVPSQDQETQQCSTASVTRFPECDDSPNLQVKDKHVNRHA